MSFAEFAFDIKIWWWYRNPYRILFLGCLLALASSVQEITKIVFSSNCLERRAVWLADAISGGILKFITSFVFRVSQPISTYLYKKLHSTNNPNREMINPSQGDHLLFLAYLRCAFGKIKLIPIMGFQRATQWPSNAGPDGSTGDFLSVSCDLHGNQEGGLRFWSRQMKQIKADDLDVNKNQIMNEIIGSKYCWVNLKLLNFDAVRYFGQ